MVVQEISFRPDTIELVVQKFPTKSLSDKIQIIEKALFNLSQFFQKYVKVSDSPLDLITLAESLDLVRNQIHQYRSSFPAVEIEKDSVGLCLRKSSMMQQYRNWKNVMFSNFTEESFYPLYTLQHLSIIQTNEELLSLVEEKEGMLSEDSRKAKFEVLRLQRDQRSRNEMRFELLMRSYRARSQTRSLKNLLLSEGKLDEGSSGRLRDVFEADRNFEMARQRILEEYMNMERQICRDREKAKRLKQVRDELLARETKVKEEEEEALEEFRKMQQRAEAKVDETSSELRESELDLLSDGDADLKHQADEAMRDFKEFNVDPSTFVAFQDPKAASNIELSEDSGPSLISPELEALIWKEREAALLEIERAQKNGRTRQPWKPVTSLPSVVTWWQPARPMLKFELNETEVLSIQKVPEELVEELFQKLGKKMPLQAEVADSETEVDKQVPVPAEQADREMEMTPADQPQDVPNRSSVAHGQTEQDVIESQEPFSSSFQANKAPISLPLALTSAQEVEGFWNTVASGDIFRFLRRVGAWQREKILCRSSRPPEEARSTWRQPRATPVGLSAVCASASLSLRAHRAPPRAGRGRQRRHAQRLHSPALRSYERAEPRSPAASGAGG
eukprot:747395-Hanusia_phi.AAC.1